MKKLSLVLIILFITVFQSTAQKILNGKVLDESGIPIPFVTIKLSTKSDSKPAAVKLTDDQGIFQLRLTNGINQLLTVTYLGYERLTKEITAADSKLTDTLTLVLKTANTTNLAGVTITARKKFITRKIDRLVMNIGSNALSAGKSSLEIFSMAPGVFVNNGSISINGNPGTRVMVNGKILQLTGDDLTSYLNTLRADEIESVEVIAHPPAEYEAQGTGGMLNIILKKQNAPGLTGAVNAGYTQGRYAGTNEGIRLNFKAGKVSAFTNYSYNRLKSYEDTRMSRTYTNQPYLFTESANRVMTVTGNRINTGVIFDVDSNQSIGVDYTGSFSKEPSTYASLALVDYPADGQDLINSGTFPTQTKTDYNNVGLNYTISLNKQGSNFQLLADYTSNKLTKKSEANSKFYDSQNVLLSDTAFRNTTPSIASIYTADLRYTTVFKNKNSLSAGVKAVSSAIDNSAQFESAEDGVWNKSTDQDYVYDYKEKILAGYTNFAGTVFGTAVKLGLRGEYTAMSGNLVTANSLTKRQYFNLFPSLFLQHKANEKGDSFFTFYYGRRLSRPSYNNLNPYESYVDYYSVARGNPYLNPAYTNIYEAGYTLKSRYVFKIAYQRDKDQVAQFIKADDKNPLLWIYTFENFGKGSNLSFSVNIPVTINKWWESSTNLDLRQQKVSTPDLEISKGIIFLQTDHDFKLSSKTSINLNAYYLSNLISGNLLVEKLYSVNVGVQHKFIDNKLSVRATVSDPFYNYKIKGTTYYKNFSSNINQRRQSRTFNLSLSYNFDLGKTFKAKQLQKSSEEERNRL